MQTYWGVDVSLHALFASEQMKMSDQLYDPAASAPPEDSPVPAGQKTGCDQVPVLTCGEENILHYQDPNPGRPARSLVTRI
jgi:hypothetical protein